MVRGNDLDEDRTAWATGETQLAPEAASTDGAAGGEVRQVDVGAPLAPTPAFARYTGVRDLGVGGMGEVRLVHDEVIHRDVAAKFIRAEHLGRHDVVHRFAREARIQGQLEHPSVVPVYDLAVSADGTPYFTMKRVRGETLTAQMNQLRRGEARVTLRRLLQALSQVALAIEYAHQRGVVHRDLKPDNIMLGAYGEVYVLDWGIAKLMDEPGTQPDEDARRALEVDDLAHAGTAELSAAPPSRLRPESAGGAVRTAAGAVSGSLGYMAPEQLRGEPAHRASDVHALGTILFELLVLERRIPLGPPNEMVRTSLEGGDTSPLARARATGAAHGEGPALVISPELDALCIDALHPNVESRLASARAFHERLEAHLDGDQQRARIRSLVDEHLDKARALLALSQASAREQAIAEISRALVLDVHREDARALMRELLTAPSDELPPEAERQLEARMLEEHGKWRKVGLLVYPMWFVLLPIAYAFGIRSYAPLAVVAACIALLFLAELRGVSTAKQLPALAFRVMLLSSFAIATCSLLFGPLVVLPACAIANGTVFAATLSTRWQRVATIVASAGTVLVPLALEWIGVLAPSYAVRDGALVLLPRALAFDSQRLTVGVFLTINVVAIVLTLVFASRLGVTQRQKERHLFLFSWNLRHFLPAPAREKAFAERNETLSGRPLP